MADIHAESDEQQFLAHALSDVGAVEGLLKFKLLHAKGYSLLMPDLILVQGTERWRWLQPKFFTACLMHFLDDFSTAALWLDPQVEGPQLTVRFSSGQFVRRFGDGSHLYRCVITGAEDLSKLAGGTCLVTETHDVLLDLFHHTTAESKQAIEASGHFRASSWNVQGTKKLQNVGYAYFTSLPAIRDDADLQRIAMSSDAFIYLMPTNGTKRTDALQLRVYRESTTNRRSTIKISVPADAVASQHVYRHAPLRYPVYFEVCQPEIYRVGLVPGAVLPIEDGRVKPVSDSLKSFGYVVLGNADTHRGLEAPYDEEETEEIFVIESCPNESIFDFWKRNANTDQMTGRFFERQVFQLHHGEPR
jgi:hypothetical protein